MFDGKLWRLHCFRVRFRPQNVAQFVGEYFRPNPVCHQLPQWLSGEAGAAAVVKLNAQAEEEGTQALAHDLQLIVFVGTDLEWRDRA